MSYFQFRYVQSEKLNDRMVELECPSIISQVKFYHVPEGIEIETLTGKYD